MCNFLFRIVLVLALLFVNGCATTSDTVYPPFTNDLKFNASRARELAEIAENKVRQEWSKLTWTKAGDGITLIGTLNGSGSDRRLVVRKGALNEYYGEASEKSGSNFGCDYTFGSDKSKGYIGKHCGENKAGLLEGWVTYQQTGRIVFLESHRGKMNGPALACECRGPDCVEVANCIDQWYSQDILTQSRERNFAPPVNFSSPLTGGQLSPFMIIPRSVPGDRGRYYLMEARKNGSLIETLHKRVGVDAVDYTRTEINCRTLLIREIGTDGESPLRIRERPTQWYELVKGSSKSDLTEFACKLRL